VYALNLTHSPENTEFWESADPLIIGAGKTEGAFETSTDRHPGVTDSIELDNDDGVTRRPPDLTQIMKCIGEWVHSESLIEEPDVWEIRLSGYRGGWGTTEVKSEEGPSLLDLSKGSNSSRKTKPVEKQGRNATG
jgi:hypothetical protein